MVKYVEVTLENADVTATAELLEEEAPVTTSAVWENLPAESDVYHGKWAGKELYSLLPAWEDPPGLENATITPIPGDLCYFYIHPGTIDLSVSMRKEHPEGLIDLAIFYGRNSLLIGPEGTMPANVFGRFVDNFEELADTCERLFREGYADETLRFEPIEDS